MNTRLYRLALALYAAVVVWIVVDVGTSYGPAEGAVAFLAFFVFGGLSAAVVLRDSSGACRPKPPRVDGEREAWESWGCDR